MGMIGAVIGAVGSIVQGMAAASQAKYQAAVAENNAIISEQNAVYELQAGQVEEQSKLMEVNQILGEAETGYAASGVDPTSGSPIRVLRSTSAIGGLDALTIRDNAARRAYGYRAEGVNFKAQAGLYRMQAQSSMIGGILGGLGQLASGFGSMVGSGGGFGGGGGSGGGGYVAPTASFAPKWQQMGTVPGNSGISSSLFAPYSPPSNLSNKLGYYQTQMIY